MPAAVPIAVAAAPALIAGTASVIGAHKQSTAAKNAAAAQERSATRAIDYQRGRDTVDDQRYQKRLDLYNQYVSDYRARNGGAPGGGGGGGAASAGVPVSLADLVGQQQGVADASGQGAPAGSVASMMGGQGGVFDWSRYGA